MLSSWIGETQGNRPPRVPVYLVSSGLPLVSSFPPSLYAGTELPLLNAAVSSGGSDTVAKKGPPGPGKLGGALKDCASLSACLQLERAPRVYEGQATEAQRRQTIGC